MHKKLYKTIILCTFVFSIIFNANAIPPESDDSSVAISGRIKSLSLPIILPDNSDIFKDNSVETIHAKGIALLNKTYEYLRSDKSNVDEALKGLWIGLYAIKRALVKFSMKHWVEFVSTQCITHPLKELIHLDPITRRAFYKPRGYAGDAIMLDYLYYGSLPIDTLSKLGSRIFEFSRMSPTASSVRERARIIASIIDTIASVEDRKIRVLSIASGHLREASCSKAAKEAKIEEFVAFDQDKESLKVVEKEYVQYGAKAFHGNIKDLLRDTGHPSLGNFDFVYSTGLFDYLQTPIASKLIEAMFRLAKPGGKVCVANMLPTTIEQGYMEAFMAWTLIYRDMFEIERLADGIPSSLIESKQYFSDPYQRVGYIIIQKRRTMHSDPLTLSKL